MPNVLARLSGTGARLKEITHLLTNEFLAAKNENDCSIKEHIGHLSDLESLHEGRIDDFLNRKEILRAADMSDAGTNTADHNQKNTGGLITDFINKRNRFVSRLESLDDDTQHFQAMHPRLRIRMRPVDMACFTAEHDDHHLASISE
ncbi:MAG: DinB family protein [Chitinophagaceae bacterium]|nr:DinB family protein [Chitinophagaceae bacterium]